MHQHFEAAKNLIDHSNSVLLTMHERMDGDDGGALLAVGAQLESMEKQVTYSIKKGVPPNLAFLPNNHKIVDDISHENFDLLVTFGCSELARTGSEKIKNLNLKIINIDHHPDNSNFGHVNIVDAKKSSVAELVYDFFIFNNWPINKDIATCLLTGIITDTGSFKHANTQSSTLKVAAQLMRKGARANKIVREAYQNKSPQILKAWGKAIKNSYYDSTHKIIYSVMTENDLAEFTALPHAAFEGFVETLNTVPEAKFAMFLRQEDNIIKGSLRSDIFNNIDVSKIAKIFGGGGHKLAAGFSVAGKLTRDETGKWKVV